MKTLEIDTQALVASRLPKKFWTLGVDTYPGSPRALEVVKFYTDMWEKSVSEGMSIAFCGPHMSCKTFLLSYLLRYSLTRPDSQGARYTTLVDLVDDVFSNSKRLDAQSAPLLFLDNVDATKNNGHITVLEELLRRRDNNNLPTFLATELSFAEGDQSFLFTYGTRSESIVRTGIVLNCESVAQKVENEAKKKQADYIPEA